MKKETQRGLEETISPMSNHWTPAHWEVSRTVSLGCAGVATALLLLLAQVGVKSTALSVSLWCSALALPVWLGFWQVCDTYTFWGIRSQGHYNQIGWILTCTIVFFAGALLLSGAIAALIWSLLPQVGAAFIALTLIALVFASWHSLQVKNFVASTPLKPPVDQS